MILNAFLQGVGAKRLQAANLERTLAFGERRAFLLSQLGLLQLELNQHTDAMRTFEELLLEDPKSVLALNELSYLVYRAGDLDQALKLMERALEIEPGNESLRENLQRVEQERERIRSGPSEEDS